MRSTIAAVVLRAAAEGSVSEAARSFAEGVKDEEVERLGWRLMRVAAAAVYMGAKHEDVDEDLCIDVHPAMMRTIAARWVARDDVRIVGALRVAWALARRYRDLTGREHGALPTLRLLSARMLGEVMDRPCLEERAREAVRPRLVPAVMFG